METMTIQIKKKTGRDIVFDLEKLDILKVVKNPPKEKFRKKLKKNL